VRRGEEGTGVEGKTMAGPWGGGGGWVGGLYQTFNKARFSRPPCQRIGLVEKTKAKGWRETHQCWPKYREKI